MALSRAWLLQEEAAGTTLLLSAKAQWLGVYYFH